jgi:hypothetical protein
LTELEKEIEEKLIAMTKRYGGKCLKWVCPGWSGVPDRILLLPGGRVIFVETKRPKGGVVAKRQEWWRRELRLLGFDAYVVKDQTDLNTLELVTLDTVARNK